MVPMASGSSHSHQRSSPMPAWPFSLLAVGISLTHFASFDPVEAPVTTDIRYFLYFAWQTAEGSVPYLDLFDPKTPLASLVGALFWSSGEILGVDPILAIRVGYLGLSAGGGLLCFLVFRSLGGGRQVCGFLALAAYMSFEFLGELPAIGNVPKLIMVVAAWATALLCHHRRWIAAGAMGALAFLDWQIGALAWCGAFITALLHGRSSLGAAIRTLLGSALATIPFLAYFTASGALRAAFDQAIVSAAFRGATSASQQTFERIVRVVGKHAGSPGWLWYVSLAGCGVVLVWLWQWRGRSAARLLQPLAIYHFGILLFSLVDFQARGDAFALLHSLVFFQAALWVAVYLGFEAWVVGREPALRRGGATAILLLALIVARPGPLHTPTAWYQRLPSLSEQREVAARLGELLGDRKLAAVESSEMLLFLRRANPLPFIYWNAASWGYYCDVEQEVAAECLRRLLESTKTGARLQQPPNRHGPNRFRRYGLRGKYAPGPEWRRVRLRSLAGRYTVVVHVREP